MNDVYTWSDDMYPIVKKSFDERYNSRISLLGNIAGIVKQDELSYKFEGLGGYGELPEYSAEGLVRSSGTKGFITTVTPTERALALPVEYKNAKLDLVGEAKKVGTRLADSAYMTVLTAFYRMFGKAFTTKGADGVAWASNAHPVSTDEDAAVFSNVMGAELSVSSICQAQKQASDFVTSDGLPFVCDFDLLLVSPELEETARSICGKNSELSPLLNPETGVGANPVHGMNYMVVGGGKTGFQGKQWAVADRALLSEVFKLVYITEPSVLISPRENPLVTDYIAYVDFAFGFGDARPIIFCDPAIA
ncbi:MAG: hypothetical protein E7608_05025 [Ruminococcaceae bacterium]|nr:hypothetical protein [Oscillospiraceae bacterium]MBO5006767.1 hypothetical protein [Clostridia bacterium]